MKKFVLALLLSLCAVPALAQRAAPVVPIRSVLTDPRDDERVVVRGQILSKLDDEKYVVADGTGRIQVEIDDDLVKGAALALGTHVEIFGEVDKNFVREPTIEAERVAILVPQTAPGPHAAPPLR